MAGIKRALVSVYSKEGIVAFAKGLEELGIELLSTGGTAKLLQDSGVAITLVSDYTGFPEMLDGRVKTLHPKIHAGLLAKRDNKKHNEQLERHGIAPIDMVVVNLYPFEEVIAQSGTTYEKAIENIDIGGPTMLRSAAKNSESVAAIVNPARYGEILDELKQTGGELSSETKEKLMTEVFMHTAAYDSAIYQYLTRRKGIRFSDNMILSLQKEQELRYGENPHQQACFYRDKDAKRTLTQLHGKELSFNNIIDLDSAFGIVSQFKEHPAACVIKHTNPCGAACTGSLAQSYSDALDCDPLSAFGSIVGLNREVDKETAAKIEASPFVEAVIAPAFSTEALDILKQSKNIRLITTDISVDNAKPDMKKVEWGMLFQQQDLHRVRAEDCKTVTDEKPTDSQLKSLLFAWRIAKHVKSNAVVLANGTKTVGIGAGQMSRVDSVKIACRKAVNKTKGSTMASDAFFPFPDAIDEAAEAGVEAIIQPGGSRKDNDVIECANKHKIAMVFTGVRHFKH